MQRKRHLRFFLGILLLLGACKYELPPLQPMNHRFAQPGHVPVAPRRMDNTEAALYNAKQSLLKLDIPLRNAVLRSIVVDGKQRVFPSARLWALEILRARKVKAAVPDLLKAAERPNFLSLHLHFALCCIDPERFPSSSLRDSADRGIYSQFDQEEVAGMLAQLGDPSRFSVIRNSLGSNDEEERVRAVRELWHFWPYQGQSSIDLYPLMQAALMDTNRRVFTAAIQQYDYAPRSPQLKQDLEQVLTQGDEYRTFEAKSVLVYRYHRKEKDFPRDIRSHCSRRKRTYLE